MLKNAVLPEANTDETVEFLNLMHPGQPRHLVSIPLAGKLEARTFLPNEEEEMHTWIESRQGTANLYFHVNSLHPGFADKKATKNDVAAALFVHVDIDDPTAEDRVRSFTPPPSDRIFGRGLSLLLGAKRAY